MEEVMKTTPEPENIGTYGLDNWRYDRMSNLPWEDINVGEGFCVMSENDEPIDKLRNSISGAASNRGKALGRKFRTRKMTDTVLQVYRVDIPKLTGINKDSVITVGDMKKLLVHIRDDVVFHIAIDHKDGHSTTYGIPIGVNHDIFDKNDRSQDHLLIYCQMDSIDA